MKREEAEEVLQPRKQGLFLVRESNNYPGDYTLCVVSPENTVEHYNIQYENNELTLDNEAFFENLIPLVEVGICCRGIFAQICASLLCCMDSKLVTITVVRR